MGDPSERSIKRLAVRLNEARCYPAGGCHGNLLPEHGPDGQFVPVHRTRNPDARYCSDQRRQSRIGRQHLVDGHAVGVQVEQSATPSNSGRQITKVRESQLGLQMAGCRGQLGDAGAMRQDKTAPIRSALDLLDAGHRPRAEERNDSC